MFLPRRRDLWTTTHDAGVGVARLGSLQLLGQAAEARPQAFSESTSLCGETFSGHEPLLPRRTLRMFTVGKAHVRLLFGALLGLVGCGMHE